MPSEKEKMFFMLAFYLIDDIKHTNWRACYSSLVSKSKDGKIDWKQMPNFIKPSQANADSNCYKKAVLKVAKTIESILRDENLYHLNPDKINQFRELKNIGQQVLDFRIADCKRARKNIQVKEEEELFVESHIGACDIWQELVDKIESAVEQRRRPKSIDCIIEAQSESPHTVVDIRQDTDRTRIQRESTERRRLPTAEIVVNSRNEQKLKLCLVAILSVAVGGSILSYLLMKLMRVF